MELRGHTQLLDAQGRAYASFDPADAAVQLRRIITRGGNASLRGNVVLGGGSRAPAVGWARRCEYQVRAGGSAAACALSEREERLRAEVKGADSAGSVRASSVRLHALTLRRDTCVGSLCAIGPSKIKLRPSLCGARS